MKIVELQAEDWLGLVFAIHADNQCISGLYGNGVAVYEYAGIAPAVGDPLPAGVKPYVADTTAFDAACAEFRATCGEICTLIGAADFRGGFDEMGAFRASEAATTAAGMALAIRWLAADKACAYEGAKLGYGQPAWWYKCWEAEEA